VLALPGRILALVFVVVFSPTLMTLLFALSIRFVSTHHRVPSGAAL
jgi:ABC-type dipeptide/oligopeptide/nickel transport system permease subunit